MKLYYATGACSLAVRIILHETNTLCEFEAVDLKTKKTAAGENFLEINPKGVVPVIQIDKERILTENSVILQYLADHHMQQITLLPGVSEFKRYRVLEWLNYVSTELHKSCGALFNANFSQEIKDNFFVPLLKTKLNYVENYFSTESNESNEFLITENFTIADAYLFVILSWLKYFKIDIKEWPNLSKYFDRLKERPSIYQSLKEEGLI